MDPWVIPFTVPPWMSPLLYLYYPATAEACPVSFCHPRFLRPLPFIFSFFFPFSGGGSYCFLSLCSSLILGTGSALEVPGDTVNDHILPLVTS